MPGPGGLGARDVTPFLVILIFVATLGPFQFGYHLVCPLNSSYFRMLFSGSLVSRSCLL